MDVIAFSFTTNRILLSFIQNLKLQSSSLHLNHLCDLCTWPFFFNQVELFAPLSTIHQFVHVTNHVTYHVTRTNLSYLIMLSIAGLLVLKSWPIILFIYYKFLFFYLLYSFLNFIILIYFLSYIKFSIYNFYNIIIYIFLFKICFCIISQNLKFF